MISASSKPRKILSPVSILKYLSISEKKIQLFSGIPWTADAALYSKNTSHTTPPEVFEAISEKHLHPIQHFLTIATQKFVRYTRMMEMDCNLLQLRSFNKIVC